MIDDRDSLRRGVSDPRVLVLRERLVELGFTIAYLAPAEVLDPQRFDDHVDAAVRSFQQTRGLLADGVVGPETLRSLNGARWTLGDRPLFYQSNELLRGDDVVALQQRMSNLGFYYGHVDGVFGPKSGLALQEVQQSLGLLIDGVCDRITLIALARISRSMSSSKVVTLRDLDRLAHSTSALHGRKVIIDPRTGSVHAMRTLDGLTEGKVTFDIATRVSARLAEFGVEVKLTRTADERLELPEQIERARALQGDILLILCCDWIDQEAASGVSSFFWGTQEPKEILSPIGERMAGLLHREVVARTRMVDLGTHARSWDQLHLSGIPAVQLDIGYLSSRMDSVRLADNAFRESIADAIVIATQRLYLTEDDDRPTGTMDVNDILTFNPNAV